MHSLGSGGSGGGRGSSGGGFRCGRGGGSRTGVRGSISLLAFGVLVGGCVGLLIGLVRGVNSYLDCDLASFDFLSVHLIDSLLLELLGGKGHEAEAAALASLAPSLELLDHEAGDRAESDLCGRWLVSVEKLDELLHVS